MSLTKICTVQVVRGKERFEENCDFLEMRIRVNEVFDQSATGQTQVGLLLLLELWWHKALVLHRFCEVLWESELEICKSNVVAVICGCHILGAKTARELVEPEFQIDVLVLGWAGILRGLRRAVVKRDVNWKHVLLGGF
jgi:hypothetical protein